METSNFLMQMQMIIPISKLKCEEKKKIWFVCCVMSVLCVWFVSCVFSVLRVWFGKI